MAGEPNPEPFREVCTTIDPSDRDVAPAVPSAAQHNSSSAASASGSSDQHKCAPKQLPDTAAPLSKLSSSVFDTDSESPQEGTPAEGQETKSRGSKDRH